MKNPTLDIPLICRYNSSYKNNLKILGDCMMAEFLIRIKVTAPIYNQFKIVNLWKKIFIMIAIISLLSTVKAQASTIILKDGRNITGDIVEQNDTKAVIKVDDVPLTYYKDEIVSIDTEPLGGQSPSIGSDHDKEKLVDQFLSIVPTEGEIIKWTGEIVPKDQRSRFLLLLEENSIIQKVTEMRREKMLEYFSLADLKGMIHFRTSPEGKAYFEDLENYNNDTMPKLIKLVMPEAIKARKQFMQEGKDSRMENPP